MSYPTVELFLEMNIFFVCECAKFFQTNSATKGSTMIRVPGNNLGTKWSHNHKGDDWSSKLCCCIS